MKEKKHNKQKKRNLLLNGLLITLLLLSFAILSLYLISAAPIGPTNVASLWNETGNTTSAAFFNISGAYIAALNLSAVTQNTHWKAFVGWVNGGFTLDDQGGSTIYDWSSALTTGRVYTTRDSGTIEWALIGCANTTTNLAAENMAMFHNRVSDNITATFQYPSTHDAFWVAGRNIGSGACPSLNTYINSAAQDDDFEEMALYDSTCIIYASIIEDDLAGYDGQSYDFQMLVPENGSAGFTGATAYYIYVELD